MTMRRGPVVAAIVLSMFMSAMEATVVATAMPTVVADLHGIELYGWVTAIYMLASTVTIPLWGKLADLRGRRPVMLAGMALFLVGSVLSGAAGGMVALIAFRGIQGAGAGALQPVALTIIGDLFTIEERGRMQGIFGAVWGLAAISGPLLGGLIVHTLGWRWVFFVNVPFGLLSAAMLVTFYRDPERSGAPGGSTWRAPRCSPSRSSRCSRASGGALLRWRSRSPSSGSRPSSRWSAGRPSR
jgi:MFS family permease